MQEDQFRWDEKYRKNIPMPTQPASLVTSYAALAKPGWALDIACGTGRNSLYLCDHGFDVDAVDISEVALKQLPHLPNLHLIQADLDDFRPSKSYALIINFNYLDRHHFTWIPDALEEGGLLLYETFVTTDEPGCHQPSNPAFLLDSGELLRAFDSLRIIHYEEHNSTNLRGEKVRIASLVAQKVTGES